MLASLFSEMRSTRPQAEWAQYVDELDSEGASRLALLPTTLLSCDPGVNLWNITGIAAKCTGVDPKETSAACECCYEWTVVPLELTFPTM